MCLYCSFFVVFPKTTHSITWECHKMTLFSGRYIYTQHEYDGGFFILFYLHTSMFDQSEKLKQQKFLFKTK